MEYKSKPRGNRVVVKRIFPFKDIRTKGGIIVPDWVPSNDDPMAAVVRMQTLEFVEVVEVGEGRADPATGKHTNGSSVKVGGTYLMRSGAASMNHMDTMPGRIDEFIVLEDTLVSEVELPKVQAGEPAADKVSRLVAVP